MNQDHSAYPPGFWQPLPDANNSFRLVRLFSIPTSHKVFIELVESRLAQRLSYDAISYTWGDPGHERPVYTASGQRVFLRKNLWICLRELCTRSHETLLWVDALCISQDDLVEKSQQVQIIGKIFRGAQRVLAWLGEGDHSTGALFQAALKVPIDQRTGRAEHLHGERLARVHANVAGSNGLVLENTMNCLLGREYWKRAWVMQECLLAHKIDLLCGLSSATWAQFFGLQSIFYYNVFHFGLRSIASVSLSSSYLPYELASAREGRCGTPISIYSMLETFGDTKCLDRRDKLFAFLEIIRESQPNHPGRLVADYTITPVEVYFRAFHAYLGNYPKNVNITMGNNLRQIMSLTTQEIKDAVQQTVDPNKLPLPLDYITGEQAETRRSSDEVEPQPNRLDPQRVYNLLEIYAACFEYLATGNLEHSGRIITWQKG